MMVVIPDDDQTLRRGTDKVEGVLHSAGEGPTFVDLPDPDLGEAASGVYFLLSED